jgi:hypothetical protein
MRTALFVGTDVHSHIVAKHILEHRPSADFQVDLYFPHRRSARTSPDAELVRYIQVEQDILHHCLYGRHMSGQADHDPFAPVAAFFGDRYQVSATGVADINAPQFVRELGQQAYDAAVSIRCYQRFGSGLIDLFANAGDQGRLLNLHPGNLPQYRGVMSYFHQLTNGDLEGLYTLHLIEPGWDTGPIIARDRAQLDPSVSVLTNYCRAASRGAGLVLDSLKVAAGGGLLLGTPQHEDRARYWKAPDAAALEAAHEKGLRLFDVAELRAEIHGCYGSEAAALAGGWLQSHAPLR